MSSLSDMWSNPITRNQRRPPPNSAPSRSRSGGIINGGSRGLGRDGGSARATTPTPDHRRRHSAMPSRNSRLLVRSGSEKNVFQTERRRDLRSPFAAEFPTLVEEMAPSSLPILHSSSGSEDEGFGPDDEILLYKLRVLQESKTRSVPYVKAPFTSRPSRSPRSPSSLSVGMPPKMSSVRLPRLLTPATPPSSFPSPLPNFSEPGEPWAASVDSSGSGDRSLAGIGPRQYFSSPLLQGTLALIRSGQMFCDENHMAVDFVRRATITGTGAQAQARSTESDVLRHALLITDAALYMLAVHMFPRAKPGGEPGPRRDGMFDLSGKPTAPEQPMSSRRAVTWAADRSSISPEPIARSRARRESAARLGDHERSGVNIEGEARGSSASGNVGGGGARAREKRIRSIQMMTRWAPEQLSRVSLPFREVPLKNGDVVARRGCSIVLHIRNQDKIDHVWLKCRSNQDRGALVEVLVRWYEANNPDAAELNVQQVPEVPLLAHLARRVEQTPRAATGRLKDTDCVIS